MTRCHAVVFDLDGTLIDSAPGLQMAIDAMLSERRLPVPDMATVTGFVGNGAAMLVEHCLRWSGADPADHPDALARFLAIYAADPVAGTTVLPGAAEALAALAAGGIRLGLCTNKPEAPTRIILDALSLGPFDAVVGGDTLSVRKPDPAPLLRVIDALGATRETALYVGDSIVDWRTAQAAGVAYVHVEGGYQSAPIPDLDPASRIANLSHLRDRIELRASHPFATTRCSCDVRGQTRKGPAPERGRRD